MKLKKYRDLFSISSGIFYYIDITPIEDILEYFKVTKSDLDLNFYLRYSLKYISPTLFNYIEEDDEISEDDIKAVAYLIMASCKPKWDKYLSLLQLDYDPIKPLTENVLEDLGKESSQHENNASNTTEHVTTDTDSTSNTTATSKDTDKGKLDIDSTLTRTDNLTQNDKTEEDKKRTSSDTQSENVDGTHTRTDDLTQADTGKSSNTRTDNLKEVVDTDKKDQTQSTTSNSVTNSGTEVMDHDFTSATTGSGTDSIFGFNSSVAVPSNSSSDQSNTTETTDYTLTKNNTTTNATTANEKVDLDSSIDTTTENTGTQKNDGTSELTRKNTGTQTTADDVETTKSSSGSIHDENSIELTRKNTGTQSTVNDETRTNESVSEGERNNVVKDETDVDQNRNSVVNTTVTVSASVDQVRELTRKGNIHFTTQSQIKEELEIWRWNLIDTIIDDVKNFITIPIY